MATSSSTQLSFLTDTEPEIRGVQRAWLEAYLQSANLSGLSCEYESWEIRESSAELSYLTHGFFRYFGKFPPPVAQRFIKEFHNPAMGPVVDPMVGSGTTLVEAVLLRRKAIGLDASPLSRLVSKVKTTPISSDKISRAIESYSHFMKAKRPQAPNRYIPKDANLVHWFYPQIQEELARTRQFIEEELGQVAIQDMFRLVLAGIIRHVSRASNGLGRMFLDPAIPVLDTQEHFVKRALKVQKGLQTLEPLNPDVRVLQADARLPFLTEACTNLVICHPPYFNVYRYSSIYKYELLWLGFDYSATRKLEVRDGFKIGKAELVHEYVTDMIAVFQNISRILVSGGRCILMVGDTFLRGDRINTTALLLENLMKAGVNLRVERVIVRHPKYTEASYAATQRRAGKDIGIKLPDHIVVLQKGSV